MLSRLFIIGFLLCLPIAIALFSQQITRTVAPPKLPATEQQVKLLGTPRDGRSKADAASNEVTEGYTLRTIKYWGEAPEGEAPETQGGDLMGRPIDAQQKEKEEAASATLAAPAQQASEASTVRQPAKAARARRNKR